MKLALPVLLISTGAFLTGANIDGSQASGLTIHEWGTFTSVAGEDGSAVEWDTLGCKSDLPNFVNDYGYRGFKSSLQGTVRMETPVMYFYSPREIEAHVKVSFPKGLITEWYPQAEYEVYQKSAHGERMRRLASNLGGIDTSMMSLTGAIEWSHIKVEPDTSPVLPVEDGPSRYYAARATDSAPITVGEQHEKFLFYRGVARFPVPLSVRLERDGRIAVQNTGKEPVPIAVLFENRAGHMGFRNVGAVTDAVTVDRPSLDSSMAVLRYDLEAALTAQGLYPAEARAMLSTWQDSWFEEGSRLIYILSSHAVDGIVPLHVDPAPVETARIFVGRIELITPEIKNSVEQAIAIGDRSALKRYDRFLDPILARISSESDLKARQIAQFREAVLVPQGINPCLNQQELYR
jgi:hypothetical protein